MSEMRLQKFLSAAGVCSRREGESYIAEGRVKVNGKVITKPGTKIDPEKDGVDVDGRPVFIKDAKIYIALNKPKGYVTSCQQKNHKVVLDLLELPERVYPVGRLDKDSTGLLLLTNDGSLHHRLLHPSFDHEKEYEVTTGRPLTHGALKKMATGMPLMGSVTRPAKIKKISQRRFLITLKEGKNRQIRRMVRKVGGHVKELKRIRIANIRLGDLKEGRWRYLTQKEKKELLKYKKKTMCDGNFW